MRIDELIADRYQVIRILGEGGCGQAFAARDMESGTDVAIKFQHEQVFQSSSYYRELADEFIGESQRLELMAKIRGVPAWIGQGEHRGRQFIVMELFSGIPLDEFIENPGATRTSVAVSILGQLCEILMQVHGIGLVHGDIKPENIMVEPDGEIKLIDMGFIHEIGEIRQPSGTPGYVAPEQLHKSPARAENDIFSLGCVLFKMLINQLPYEGNSRRVFTGAQAFPSAACERLDPLLRDLGLAMVAADFRDRPSSAAVVLCRLVTLLPQEGVGPDPKVRRPDVTWWYRKGLGMPLIDLCADSAEGPRRHQ